MIVYEATKAEFVEDVMCENIDKKIYSVFKRKIGRTSESERRSWRESMIYMNMVVNNDSIPDNSGVAIEFNIPATSKRIDFILTGNDEKNQESVIIIELKRWDYIEKVEGKDGIVSTYLGRGIHETTHPSYQAWSYAAMITDYNETVQKDKIRLYPCAYLHNYA